MLRAWEMWAVGSAGLRGGIWAGVRAELTLPWCLLKSIRSLLHNNTSKSVQ